MLGQCQRFPGKKSTADFIAIQEAKKFQGDTDQAEAEARSRGWHVRVLPCARTDLGNPSAGVGVGARKHIGVSLPDARIQDSPLIPVSRFNSVLVGAVCRGGVHFCSVYLYDTIGVHA